MIQRVQSVWLFLASLTIFLLLLLPVVSNQVNGSEFWIMVTGLYQKTNETAIKVESFSPLYISAAAVGLICFISIFAFRNRTAQKRIIIDLQLCAKNTRRYCQCVLWYWCISACFSCAVLCTCTARYPQRRTITEIC